MSKHKKGEAKYRPYLSLHEIEYILVALVDHTSSEASSIRASLRMISLKAQAGIATGSYHTKPRETISDRLGFAINDSDDEARYLAGEMSPEEESKYLETLMKGESI